MSRIYLVRHGQAGLFQEPAGALTPLGESQAARLAQFDVIRRDAASLRPAAVAIVIAALDERAAPGANTEAAFLLTARTE